MVILKIWVINCIKQNTFKICDAGQIIGQATAIIEAKRAEEDVRLTFHEEQSEAYAKAKLKYRNF